MNVTRARDLLSAFWDDSQALLGAKNTEYARTEQQETDFLANFTDVGEMVKVTCPSCSHSFPVGAKVAWASYFMKHVFSVLASVGGTKKQTESIRSRFQDLHNYAALGYLVWEDGVGTAKEAPTTPDCTLCSWRANDETCSYSDSPFFGKVVHKDDYCQHFVEKACCRSCTFRDREGTCQNFDSAVLRSPVADDYCCSFYARKGI